MIYFKHKVAISSIYPCVSIVTFTREKCNGMFRILPSGEFLFKTISITVTLLCDKVATVISKFHVCIQSLNVHDDPTAFDAELDITILSSFTISIRNNILLVRIVKSCNINEHNLYHFICNVSACTYHRQLRIIRTRLCLSIFETQSIDTNEGQRVLWQVQ